MHEKIISTIQELLKPKKPLVAIKAWKEIPKDIPAYEDKAFPGTCTQIGEVIATGKTFYIETKNVYCTGGVLAAGVLRPMSEKQSRKVVEMHLSITKDYVDIDTAMNIRKEILKDIPMPKEKNKALQIGLLKDIERPDVVLLFCNSRTADIISRAYTYRAGEPIHGFGSIGGCNVTIQYPFTVKKPVFTYSDVAWRKFTALSDDELTMSFPYDCLVHAVEDLPLIADHYEHYAEGMDV
jgi:uncharacterized protein (DUF169 family)